MERFLSIKFGGTEACHTTETELTGIVVVAGWRHGERSTLLLLLPTSLLDTLVLWYSSR